MLKLNARLGGGLAVAALAGLLAVSAPTAAFAQKVGDTDFADTPAIEKTWTADSADDLVNGESFQFKLTYVGADKVFDTWVPNVLFKYSPMRAGESTTVDLDANWKDLAAGKNSATSSVTAGALFNALDFKTPGVYKFELSEVVPDTPAEGMRYDDSVYEVQVDVARPDDYPTSKSDTRVDIKGVTINKKGDTAKGTAAFNNTSVTTKADLVVTEKVSGSAADTSDSFTFTVELSGLKGEHSYLIGGAQYFKKLQQKQADGTYKDVNAVTDGTYRLTLAHGQRLEVSDLPKDATWKVTQEADDRGYSVSSSLVDGEADTDSAADAVAQGVVNDGDTTDEVDYVNKKAYAAPTGIDMNAAPFVVAGAVGAGGLVALLISRSRRAHEDF